MIIGNKNFENYTYVMAIINLTPDSFWKGSRNTCDSVLFACEKAIKDGAAIIDLGAQSTRPGYVEVPPEEEIARFEKPLQLIKRNFDVPVSLDTYFSKSAKVALELGADMINDVWGLTHDEDMAKVIADYNGAVCIMHNAKQKLQGDIWQPILDFLKQNVKRAIDSGIDKNKICLDGGVGFAKDKEQNWELTNNYDRLNALGYPLLLGTSRKSMFGGNVEDRLPATVNTTRLAAQKKILFVRVHDVKENYDAIREEYERN
jgi:dihydropteroate synthase